MGTVVDATGGMIPNAKVEAKNVDTGVVSSTTTTGDGDYRIGGLINGTYSITASAPGFSGATLQNVTVDANKIATQNLTLAVGQVSTNVEVTESIVNIDTTTATIQNTFDQQWRATCPSAASGSAWPTSLLNAGVASNGGIGAGEGPSVGGQRPHNNNFMIEGVDNNNRSVTGSLLRINPERRGRRVYRASKPGERAVWPLFRRAVQYHLSRAAQTRSTAQPTTTFRIAT